MARVICCQMAAWLRVLSQEMCSLSPEVVDAGFSTMDVMISGGMRSACLQEEGCAETGLSCALCTIFSFVDVGYYIFCFEGKIFVYDNFSVFVLGSFSNAEWWRVKEAFV